MQPYRQATDEEWARIEPLIPELKFNPKRDPRGRPMTNRRECLNATIWVMYSGASWQTLPRKYPSYQTCHRSFKAWYDAGVMHKIAHTLFGQSAESFLEIVSARIRTGTRESGLHHLGSMQGAGRSEHTGVRRMAGNAVAGKSLLIAQPPSSGLSTNTNGRSLNISDLLRA